MDQNSIPTAPTIHLPDGWTLNKNTRGQKGADSTDDLVPFFFSAARVTTGHTISVSNRYFLERRFWPTFGWPLCHLWRARRQAQPYTRWSLSQGLTQLSGLPLRHLYCVSCAD